MTEALQKILTFLIGALLLMVVSGVLGGIIGYNRGNAHCEELPLSDTVVIHTTDTVTLVEPRDTLISVIWKPYPVAVHDTTWIVKHTTDSIFISLPYEHRYWQAKDTLEIWHSGIESRIDSAKIYNRHTTELIKQPYEVVKMPLLTLDAGVAAFYQYDQVFPCAVAEMRYNASKTTFSAFGAIDHRKRWMVGGSVTYRMNIIK